MRYINKTLSFRNVIISIFLFVLFNIVVLVLNSFNLVTNDDLNFINYLVLSVIVGLIIAKIFLIIINRQIRLHYYKKINLKSKEIGLDRILIQMNIANFYAELINSYHEGKIVNFTIDKNNYNLLHINEEIIDISIYKEKMNEEQIKIFEDLKTIITSDDLIMIEEFAKKILSID